MVKSLKSGFSLFMVLCILFFLSSLHINAKSVRVAKIQPVTIEGVVNTELVNSSEIVIQLYNDNFHAMKVGEDVSYWFKNLPSGLKAKVHKYVNDGESSINIKLEGLPKEASEQLILVNIPKLHIKGDTDMEVSLNTEVKYHILTSHISKATALSEKTALFDDVNWDSWYSQAISHAVEKGLMNGTTETRFEPNKLVTRGQLAEIFYRFKGRPKVEGNPGFTDVSQNDYYYNAVSWASQNEIFKGKGVKKFAANDNVTREELAVLLYRMANRQNTQTKLEPNLEFFCDHSEISVWALDAIYWTVSNGLLKGANDTSLCPQGHATRAEIAAIMMRFEKLDVSTPKKPSEN